jgi:hypothetical protein
MDVNMTEEETARDRLSPLRIVVVAGLGIGYLCFKVWRMSVIESHGFFSWSYLRAQAVSLGILVIVGVPAFWIVGVVEKRTGRPQA